LISKSTASQIRKRVAKNFSLNTDAGAVSFDDFLAAFRAQEEAQRRRRAVAQLFDAHDKDNDEVLNKTETKALMKSLGLESKTEQLTTFVQQFAGDESKLTIERQKFLDKMAELDELKATRATAIASAFKSTAVDGYLKLDDVVECLKRANIDVSNLEALQLLIKTTGTVLCCVIGSNRKSLMNTLFSL
jgi:Ca2+-binding EF-hand superfamily protein